MDPLVVESLDSALVVDDTDSGDLAWVQHQHVVYSCVTVASRLRYPSHHICSLNFHSLFLVNVMTTSKLLDDRTFKNKDQTVVGRREFTVHQPQAMSLEFLRSTEISSNPLFALTLKIRIVNQKFVVYHDDEVESVCEDFCSTHRLPPTAKTALVEQVLVTKETFNQKELRELDVCSR
ncbi:hypothetical protein BLNAU_10413 [Blattamonas nauphoetae]|uniref:Uncharacterized protein n=1 Tax=Blattamonas nauphoetae TaxID=2049346 RepID=A0ABQ9XQ57_9EUKA|nr:hypothetical protein BLNAU_10413 [Blattamonas nauphoetae]